MNTESLQKKAQISNNISETLFITLNEKAKDAMHEEPLLGDCKSLELKNKIDFDFSKFGSPVMSHVGICLRSRIFDDASRKFINKNKNPVIVNIGCGLDTRKNRIGEEGKNAFFYQIDLPEVIDFRKKILEQQENEMYIAESMFETAWMEKIKNKHPTAQFLLIVEGVLMYFNERDLKDMFDKMARYFPGADLRFDIIGKKASKHSDKHDVVKKTNAKFKFGTDDSRFLEKWNLRYEFIDEIYYPDIEDWKRVGFFYYSMTKYIPFFKKVSRLLHYRIKNINE